MADNIRFGRTQPKKQGLLSKLKGMNLKDLKNLKWKDLTPAQRRKIIFGGIIILLLILLLGLFTQNDEEMYKSNVGNFIERSTVYDVQGTAKTTVSSAHQLIVNQQAKMKQTKARNYKTKVNKVESKIVSQKGNSIIGTTRVETTEQIGSNPAADFSHLFVFQGQKVGGGWKIGNMLEAEAKKMNKASQSESN